MNQKNVKQTFEKFFYKKFQSSHGDYYGGDNSKLKKHFESGEVRVPVPDLFKLVDEWFNSIVFKNPSVEDGTPV
jgi:hypothetical protein